MTKITAMRTIRRGHEVRYRGPYPLWAAQVFTEVTYEKDNGHFWVRQPSDRLVQLSRDVWPFADDASIRATLTHYSVGHLPGMAVLTPRQRQAEAILTARPYLASRGVAVYLPYLEYPRLLRLDDALARELDDPTNTVTVATTRRQIDADLDDEGQGFPPVELVTVNSHQRVSDWIVEHFADQP